MSDVELSRITIRRFLTDDGQDLVAVEQDNGDGDDLTVVEALGLLQLAIFDVCNKEPGVAGGSEKEQT